MNVKPELFSREITTRYPLEPDTALNEALNDTRESLTGTLLRMISDAKYKDYVTFATNGVMKPRAKGDSYGSLEGIHNTYHNWIGGKGGHMSEVSVAAFDPVFWFHHV